MYVMQRAYPKEKTKLNTIVTRKLQISDAVFR